MNYHLKPGGHEKTIQLRTFAGDIEIFYEIFWKKIYEHPVLKEHEINTIADLGANIGMSSLYFSQQFPTAMIYAVEPDPSNFDMLTANLSEEILQSSHVPVRAAIYSADGMVNLKQNAKAYNTGIAEGDTGIAVRAVTLDTFIREMMITGIDLLKIDVEGSELDVLKGAERMFKEKKIKICVFEFGQTIFDMGNTIDDFKNFFNKHDYRIDNISKDQNLFPVDHKSKLACFSVLFVEPN